MKNLAIRIERFRRDVFINVICVRLNNAQLREKYKRFKVC